MFLGLKDKLKSEEVADYESKLKALTWESGLSSTTLSCQILFKSYSVPSNLTRCFINTTPFNFDNRNRKQKLCEHREQLMITTLILGIKIRIVRSGSVGICLQLR